MADSDDWRVTISVSGQAPAGQAQQSSSLRQVEEDVRGQVGRSVVGGAGDAQIFLYAGTETAARDAERIALDVLDQHGIAAESACTAGTLSRSSGRTRTSRCRRPKLSARRSTSGLWTPRPLSSREPITQRATKHQSVGSPAENLSAVGVQVIWFPVRVSHRYGVRPAGN